MQNSALDRFRSLPHPPAPLLPVAISVISGIIIGRYDFLPLPIFIAGLVICIVAAGTLIFYRKVENLFRYIPVLLCVGFGCLAGARYHLIYSYYPGNHIISYCDPSRQRLATVDGTIITAPYIAKTCGAFAKFDSLHEPHTIFVMRSQAIKTIAGMSATGGLCQVIVKQPSPNLRAGQKIRIDCWISLRGGPNNPGQFDYTDCHRAARNLVSCSVSVSDAITILAESDALSNLFKRFQYKIQTIAHGALIEDVYIDSQGGTAEKDSQDFLAALLLGQRYRISHYLSDAFMRTGTIHFLSVSGLHVGIVAGFAWLLGWFFHLPRRLQGLLSLIVIIAYIFIIPACPPVLRAGIICIVFCLAYMGRRTVSSLNLLSFGAIVILLVRPLDLFSASFQLSFVAVLGLLIFCNAVYNRRFAANANRIDLAVSHASAVHYDMTWWRRFIRYFLRVVWGLFVVALVAWVVGFGLSAYHFNRIALFGVFASVVLSPLIFLAMLLGFAKLILTALLPGCAWLLTWALSAMGSAAIFLTETFARLPYSSINLAAVPLWFIGIFYLLLLWAGVAVRRDGVIPRSSIYGLLAWGIIFVWLAPFDQFSSGGDSDSTTLNVLAIGHGTGTVVQLPDGKVICYDIGSTSNFNLAANIVGPFLRSRGIGRIEALFISHPNLDHYNGVVDLCHSFDVGMVYLNEHFTKDTNSATKMLLESLEEMSQPIGYLSRNCRLQNHASKGQADYEIDVLWPPRDHPSCKLDKNDSSLVLRISDANGSMLLCGDIGKIPQQLLVELEADDSGRLKADLLLLPHHGSISTLIPEFVRTVGPQLCINSCGFMRQSSLDKLHHLFPDQKILHTYNTGAVTATLTPSGVKARTFR